MLLHRARNESCFSSIPDNSSRIHEEKCFHDIVYHVRNVRQVRALGLMLKIESGKLDDFEQDTMTDTRTMIVKEWFESTPMSITERYEELARVLKEPALQERQLARDLQQYVRRGSSIDSAISEMSNTSITSPTEALPQYQMSQIGKSVLKRYASANQ